MAQGQARARRHDEVPYAAFEDLGAAARAGDYAVAQAALAGPRRVFTRAEVAGFEDRLAHALMRQAGQRFRAGMAAFLSAPWRSDWLDGPAVPWLHVPQVVTLSDAGLILSYGTGLGPEKNLILLPHFHGLAGRSSLDLSREATIYEHTGIAPGLKIADAGRQTGRADLPLRLRFGTAYGLPPLSRRLARRFPHSVIWAGQPEVAGAMR